MGLCREVPHLMVMFFGEHGRFRRLSRNQDRRMECAVRGAALAWDSDLDGVEPFGFTDGISQPQIDWEGSVSDAPADDYSTWVALGGFCWIP